MSTPLTPPFPWYGGKRRLAPTIWHYLRNPTVYIEPFAGSLAVLLARPTGAGPREIVGDTDGGICNTWRALQHDPDQVAYWADYPTIHQDLTARHKWLRQWIHDHAHQLSDDPTFYDARAAGWWLWGISLWIGGQWCATNITPDKRPLIKTHQGGTGVNAQTIRPHPPPAPKRPKVRDAPGGYGISAQTKRPRIESGIGGTGIAAQRTTRPDLIAWFQALQTRLHQVVVINRSWEHLLTPTLLQQTPSVRNRGATVGIYLDPPYRTTTRSTLYQGDQSQGDHPAEASYQWAIEHGNQYRIAYSMHDGDYPTPPGWTEHRQSFGGIRREDRRTRQDLTIFSPACHQAQPALPL